MDGVLLGVSSAKVDAIGLEFVSGQVGTRGHTPRKKYEGDIGCDRVLCNVHVYLNVFARNIMC